jgi:hypothetical protein
LTFQFANGSLAELIGTPLCFWELSLPTLSRVELQQGQAGIAAQGSGTGKERNLSETGLLRIAHGCNPLPGDGGARKGAGRRIPNWP